MDDRWITYYNSTIITTQNITLIPDANTTLTFSWNITAVPNGNYAIWAKAGPNPGEKDVTDNSFTDGTVTVTIPGDVNGDGVVDLLDVGVTSAHWHPGPPPGPLGYDVNVDINNDGQINILDAAIISANWYRSW